MLFFLDKYKCCMVLAGRIVDINNYLQLNSVSWVEVLSTSQLKELLSMLRI